VTKCRGLTAEGMTAHHWCGSYSLPAATITGSVRREVRAVSCHHSGHAQRLPSHLLSPLKHHVHFVCWRTCVRSANRQEGRCTPEDMPVARILHGKTMSMHVTR